MFRKDNNGFTLRYSGMKFSPEAVAASKNHLLSTLEKTESDFSNLGALTIRMNLGERQRAALLGAMCRSEYADNSVEKTANGNNENVFTTPEDASPATKQTRRLEQIALLTLGVGKVLNEFSQPLKQKNSMQQHGEQFMWDVMHTVVWNLGINIPFQLSDQGFIYVCHPAEMDAEQIAIVESELANGNYKIQESSDGITVLTASGIALPTSKFSDAKISVDADFKKTTQQNGLVINVNGVEAPLGWIIHRNEAESKLIPHDDTEDLFRVIAIGRGGFHTLSSAQQNLLMSGLFQSTTETTFTQNRTFNAVYTISKCLHQTCGFDPSQLLRNGVTRSYTRMHDLAEKSDIIEDFLTGNLITEMTQSLRQSLSNSVRTPLPHQCTDSFAVINNTNKAVAYAYDLKKKDGTPVLTTNKNMPDYTDDADMIDVSMNGVLQHPDLAKPKHTAALLATAVLVTEQMIIEQLLRDAVKHGDQHPNALALKEILNDDDCYAQLVKMAASFEANEAGPILGLQFEKCAELIEIVRKKLGHDVLIDLTEKLYQMDAYASGLQTRPVKTALEQLTQTDRILQTLEGISCLHQGSRGIHAGLSLVRNKLSATKTHSANSWCTYFAAAVVPVVIGGVAYAANEYIRDVIL